MARTGCWPGAIEGSVSGTAWFYHKCAKATTAMVGDREASRANTLEIRDHRTNRILVTFDEL
jgi:hypothetical protein